MSEELVKLDSNLASIVENIIVEEDFDKTNQLVELFNWNISKKNVVRLKKLNDLFDTVTDKIADRFEKRPDQFSNDDLLNYMKAVQGAIDSSNKALASSDQAPPIINQNNTQINVNVEQKFSRESRERILEAIRLTLDAAQETELLYQDKTILSEDEPNE